MTACSDIQVSVIIPVYNEEQAIAATVVRVHELGLTDCEVLVIDDGSTDATARAAEAAGARVISHPYNIGNGAAVKTGIRAARGLVCVFLDGDGQHDPRDIPRLLAEISKYHMVVGARTKASDTDWHRDLANFVYNRFASLIANFPIQDLTSGFRVMRAQDARRFCDMFPNTFSYPTTSTLAFLRSGRSLKYVPIRCARRTGRSKIRLLKDGSIFFLIILKIAMAFSPLRVFIPISAALFVLGLARYLQTFLMYHHFTNMAHLLMNSAVIVFMLGLIAEQIASLRLERGDKLYQESDPERYAGFEEYAAQLAEAPALQAEAPPAPQL